MKFHLTEQSKLFLQGLIAVCSASSGYRAGDLKVTAKQGGVQFPERNPKHNGRLRFEIACQQSFGEFEVDAVVEQAGEVITNSFYLSQIPDVHEDWQCDVRGKKLYIANSHAKFDFMLSDTGQHGYNPTYCTPDIDISQVFPRIGQLATILGGFTERKVQTDVQGSVRIAGLGREVTFEATNYSDALFCRIPLASDVAKAWTILLPISQLASWSALPELMPVRIGVDANFQLTLDLADGMIRIQHNTLSNLLDSFNDVRELAEMFFKLGDSPDDNDDPCSFDFQYYPGEINGTIQRGTIFADGDPSLTIYGAKTVGGSDVKVVVQTSTVDSDFKLKTGVAVNRDGQMCINKSSMALVNRIAQLSGIVVKPDDPETWLHARAKQNALIVSSPDHNFIAMTSQVAV